LFKLNENVLQIKMTVGLSAVIFISDDNVQSSRRVLRCCIGISAE